MCVFNVRMMTITMRMLAAMLARRFFLPVTDPDIHLSGADAAAQDLRNLQPGAYIQGGDGLLKQLWRHARVHQSAEKHIAADSGKTFEVRDAHD